MLFFFIKRKWHVESQKNKNSRHENKLRLLLKKLKLPDSFPSELVYNAYMNPDVDKSSEEFSWSLPNLDLLRKFEIFFIFFFEILKIITKMYCKDF